MTVSPIQQRVRVSERGREGERERTWHLLLSSQLSHNGFLWLPRTTVSSLSLSLTFIYLQVANKEFELIEKLHEHVGIALVFSFQLN